MKFVVPDSTVKAVQDYKSNKDNQGNDNDSAASHKA